MQVLPAENYQLKSGGNNAKKKEEKEEGKVNRRGGWWGNEGNGEREQSDGVERRKTVWLCTTLKRKKTVEGSCDAGKVDERSILLITANQGGVGVSQGPRLAFFSPSDW